MGGSGGSGCRDGKEVSWIMEGPRKGDREMEGRRDMGWDWGMD